MIKKFFTVLAAIAMLALSACTQEEINQFLNPINSIKLDQTQVEMNVGETLLLFATVDPFKGAPSKKATQRATPFPFQKPEKIAVDKRKYLYVVCNYQARWR